MDSQHITEKNPEQVTDQLVDAPGAEDAATADAPVASDVAAAPSDGHRYRARRWAIAGLAILALIGAGATLASTTVQETAENVMTFGDVKIKAVILAPADDGEWTDVTGEPLDAPYGKAERRVAFTNTGTHPMFVRARVGVNAVRAAAEPAGETEVMPWTQATFALQLETGTMPAADADEATDGWYAGTGEQAGWYYYGRILAPGETTEPLATAVDLADFNAMATKGYHFELDVLGQGVQSEHQKAPASGVLNALTAVGWPTDEADDASGGSTAATTKTTTIAEGQE